MPRLIRQAAAVLALAAGMGGASQATPVNVDGTFLWFNSFLGTDRTSFVNGTALTPGAQVSPTRNLSNTVNFTAPTTTVAFNYDPTCCGFVPPNPLVNTFEFIAAPEAVVNVGDTFQLGAFRFTNGQWWEQADIGFRLTSHSTDPTLNGHTWEGTLRLISVSAIPTFIDPLADARAEADYFWVLERPDLPSMRVYDRFRQPPGSPGYAESFAIDGRIGSLIPTGIVALGSAGFTDPSVQPALSGPDVPEPGTLALLGIGLLGLGFTSRFGRLLRRAAMRYCLHRILAVAVALGVSVPMLQAASVVTTGGFFYNYFGPVGYPIYPSSGGPQKDGASAYDSYISPNGAWPAVLLPPQWPHWGYEDPRFSGAGVASLQFAPSQMVEFWNRVANSVDASHNSLTINGAETPGVEINPLTHTSNLLLLATVVYQNGIWFANEPAYDPGYGPLYGESAFAFSLIAIPDPFIGSPAFPGPPPYHVWNDTLRLVPRFGGADRLYFLGAPWLGSVYVDERVAGSFEIWGRIGSLEPVELRNPSLGITLGPSPDITPPGGGSAVPEPSTLLLAGLGLLTVLICRRPAKRSGRPGFEIHR